MQSGSDSASGAVTVWMTLMSRTSAGALEAESLVRLTGDISVLEARRPDEVSRRFCLLAQSASAVSRLAFCLADLSLTEEVRVQRCSSDAAPDGPAKDV
jgi:hypothetical protein